MGSGGGVGVIRGVGRWVGGLVDVFCAALLLCLKALL